MSGSAPDRGDHAPISLIRATLQPEPMAQTEADSMIAKIEAWKRETVEGKGNFVLITFAEADKIIELIQRGNPVKR